YASNPKICKECPFLPKCTHSKNHTKQIHRHIWQDYLDEVEHFRHTSINKQIYEKRKETIGRVFADMKEKHGMRWTTLRTKRRVQMQAMLVFAAMNLKKLANWCWRGGNPHRFFTPFRLIYLKTPSVILSQRAFVFNLRPPLLKRGGLDLTIFFDGHKKIENARRRDGSKWFCMFL